MTGQNAPRRARKRDDAEPAIVDALRAVGCKVMISDDGCWDLVVLSPFLHDHLGRPRRGLRLLEVKSPGGKLRISQTTAINNGWPISVVYNVEDALTAVGCLQEY